MGLAFVMLLLLASVAAGRRPYPVGALLHFALPLVRAVARGGNLRAVCRGEPIAQLSATHTAYLEALCERYAERQQRGRGTRVVVVGGGPAGLLSALFAYRSGASVTVLEKRRSYGRSLWFDISNGAWGASRAHMDLFGLSALMEELEVETFPRMALTLAVGIQCQVLEKLLATTCLMLGIDVRYGEKYASLAQGGAAVVMSSGAVLPFDVLIAADGARSLARRAIGIEQYTVPDMDQMSLFVSFNTFPQSRAERSADWEDRLYSELGVVAAFSRLFGQQNDIQVLLSDRLAKSIGRGEKPLWLLFSVVQIMFPGAFATLAELQLAVNRIDVVTAHLVFSRRVTVCISANCSSVGLIAGDSVFPAHYRLGIGVNNALESMFNMAVFLRKLRVAESKAEWRQLVEEKQQFDRARVENVFRFQANIMFLETQCGVRVQQYYKEVADGKELKKSLFEYGREKDPSEYFEVIHGNATLSLEQALNRIAPLPDAARKTPFDVMEKWGS